MALYYQKQEEEAIARGDFVEEIVDVYPCQICKKTFKKEGQLENHLKSKKHKEAEQKFKAGLTLDEKTEMELKAE